jgi:ABC-type ATPase involved in cell division
MKHAVREAKSIRRATPQALDAVDLILKFRRVPLHLSVAHAIGLAEPRTIVYGRRVLWRS